MRIDHPTFLSVLALGVASTTLVAVAVSQAGHVDRDDQAATIDRQHAQLLRDHAERLESTVDALEEELELLREARVDAAVADPECASLETRSRGLDLECGAGGWVVDREVLLAALQEPGSYVRHVRVVPAIEDGRQRGFKLYGLRRGTLLWVLGLRNGDLLTTFNGHPLDETESVMATYTVLEEADLLVLDLERKGESRRITIEVQS